MNQKSFSDLKAELSVRGKNVNGFFKNIVEARIAPQELNINYGGTPVVDEMIKAYAKIIDSEG